MTELPPEVLAIIVTKEGEWSDHALDEAELLELHWEDVAEVARTAGSWKRTRDERQAGGYVDAVVGRDMHGRRLYMAGKVRSYAGHTFWYVITMHEAA